MFNMIINGFDTGTIPNCYVTDYGEEQMAQPRFDNNTIYGANGDYPIYDGAYDGYDKTVSLYVVKEEEVQKVLNQFNQQNNVVEFGHRPGSIFYADYAGSSFRQNGIHAWTLEIKLKMHPFRYLKNNTEVVLTSNGTVTNPGTVYSEPVITVEGNGDVTLTIGKQTMQLTIDTKATIDCRHKKQNVYDKNGNLKNTLRKRGGFFEIAPGTSGIAVSGTVSKITIKGNWRYKV
nr:MAG TPA: distal tail protein [Caudoviricetes sp.]